MDTVVVSMQMVEGKKKRNRERESKRLETEIRQTTANLTETHARALES